MKILQYGIFFSIFFFIIFQSNEEVKAFIIFEDTTEFAGVSYIGDTYGASWGDFNNDKWVDLFVGNHGNHGNGTSLYLNNKNGTFTDIIYNLDLSHIWKMDLHTASWVDYENDGDQDLLIVVGGGVRTGTDSATNNIFLINNNESFTDEATKLNLDYPLGRGRMPIWTDINNDGLLDVILVNLPRLDGKAPSGVFIQKNNVFEDVTISSGINIGSATSGQLSDLNLDRNLDLAFLFSSQDPNVIYNLTVFPFNEIRTDLKIPYLKSVYGVSFNDFNGDLLTDIFLSRSGVGSYQLRDDILLIHDETGFIDFSENSGLENPSICRDTVTGDFDNDMDIDIFQICSMWKLYQSNEESHHKNLPNRLYENLGNGTFKRIFHAGSIIESADGVAGSVSLADFNNDGFLDIYITNTVFDNFGPSQLFKNLGNENHWLEIDLVGTVSNRDAIGAHVFVNTDDKKQLREQNGGMHYRSQDHQRLHFGLGNNTEINSIIVYWPSGIVSGLLDIPSNNILELVEPYEQTAPYKQRILGIQPMEIICDNELTLILKPTIDKSVCVKTSTALQLIERGWRITD